VLASILTTSILATGALALGWLVIADIARSRIVVRQKHDQ
jgi:hypothetical protein